MGEDLGVDDRSAWDDIARERAGAVLRQAFVAAQFGMPAEDRETAIESLWILLEALLVDHLAPDERTLAERAERRTSMGTHWRRIVTTAVTHTFVLGGDFVQPEQLADAVDERAADLVAGRLWHSRRPPGPGALVLRANDDLSRLEATCASGAPAGADELPALVDLIAVAVLGAVMAGEEDVTTSDAPGPATSRGRWARDEHAVAAAFGIADVQLVATTREGWVCDECGCLFAGRVEAGTAYPDRYAPIGRGGPCDSTTPCACHSAPIQREVR